MALRQEQIVFLGAAALLGFLVYTDITGTPVAPRGGGRGGDPPVFADHDAPDLALVMSNPRKVDELGRALFEPPREVRPLPLLPLEPPPFEPLATLVPPPVPGPAPHLHGKLLRSSLAAVDVPELFGQDEEIGSLLAEEDGGESFAVDEKLLTAAERAERVEGYKKLYDWIFVGQLRFGQIRNDDRYTLARRPDAPVRFVELDPATGQERFAGSAPIEYARERVEDFGFADNVTNQIELRRLEFGETLSHGDYEDALAFAAWCVEQRLESERALAVAEEFYKRVEPLAEQDPAPRLGLARCREAAFDFEAAFRIYNELLEGRFAEHPAVLTRLALLEARFRMGDRALARLREAERFGRTSWQVQWALGRLLLELGEHTQAAEHLALAGRYEPSAPEEAPVRADIRADLGAARLALGELTEARTWFRQALQAAPTHEAARAGLLAVSYLERREGGLNGSDGAVGAELDGAGAELLLARGLDALASGDWFSARERLMIAAEADPFAAGRAWRSLAWLADHTGYGEDALRFAEQALENDPTDPYTLYLRGRLLTTRDDFEGAREALIGALDRELEYADALAALGWIAFQQDQHENAERYLERALELSPDQADWHALRGLNWLDLARPIEAEASFRAAIDRVGSHPTARNGLAWVQYVRGDATEAMTLFREHDDARRAFAETDPYRTYARRQIERISDHVEKVIWGDRFERDELRGGWIVDESAGPTHRMFENAVQIEGDFRGQGRARVWRARNAADFVSFEAHVTVLAGTTARVGVFLSKERPARGGGLVPEIQTEVTASRHREGALQTRFAQRGADDAPYVDVPILDWPVGETRIVRIERVGSSSDTRVRIVVDGIPVAEQAVPNMGQTTDDLRMGVFAEGEPGRSVKLRVEQVDQVFRQR